MRYAMIQKERNGVRWLEFELLQEFEGLWHGVFLRPIDVSQGCDLEELRGIHGARKVICPTQVHGKKVCKATTSGLECDALVTDEKGIALVVKHADCQPAIFYDPIRKVLGTVHAGWRGSVQNIYRETIAFLKKHFGVNPTDLRICIGPSLGPKKGEFIHYKKELPESFWSYQPTPNHFDFWAIGHDQLTEEGVPENQIEIASMDTFANEKDFYSHRRGKDLGRHGTFATLL